MIKLLNHCIELHNPTDAERKVLKVLMRSVDFKEEDYWDTGVVDMSLPQLAKEAGVSLWELIRALFFWQSVALISIDVGREENDDIILFCQPYAFMSCLRCGHLFDLKTAISASEAKETPFSSLKRPNLNLSKPRRQF